MPKALWGFFKDNRELIEYLPRIASKIISKISKKRNIKYLGMFIAIHTFGHDLKWNVHLHLSVTMGGLTNENTWKTIRFANKTLMPMWRYEVITMLRKKNKQGEIKTSNNLLNQEYNKNWIIHLAKPTKSAWRTVSYLGRYLKRPPLPTAKLMHDDGKNVIFKYTDRVDNTQATSTLEINTFLEKFTQHIPEKGFRMVRYYGFLANAVRGKYLPLVYRLLNQTIKNQTEICWRTLMNKTFGTDPLKCILCGAEMACVGVVFGPRQSALMLYHEALAKAKFINC